MGAIRYTTTEYRTLGEFVNAKFPGYEILFGSAPLEQDITHGVEVEIFDNSDHGHGVSVSIYPFEEWTDGCYRPVHYWGSEHYLYLHK